MTTKRVTIITGASSGMGLALVKKRLNEGDIVIATVRSKNRQIELEKIFKNLNSSIKENLIIKRLELLNFDSIDIFCSDIIHTFPKVDVIVCNAGAYIPTYEITKDGFEAHMQTHFLSNLYLILKLMPVLVNSLDPTIIQVCPNATGKVKVESYTDLFKKVTVDPEHYDSVTAFFESNLAQLLLTKYLQQCFPVKSFAVDPGSINTDLYLSRNKFITKIKNFAANFSFNYNRPEKAIRTTNYLLTTKRNLVNGGFYSDKKAIETPNYLNDQKFVFETVDFFAKHLGLVQKD